jgi:protein transport protein SEC24
MTAFHGNFFLRSTDLLALPNVSPDNSYAVEMAIQDNLASSVACFQTALLHTSSTGLYTFVHTQVDCFNQLLRR